MASIPVDPLLIELIRTEDRLRGELFTIQRVKKYVLDTAKQQQVDLDLDFVNIRRAAKDLDELLHCSETLE